MTGPSLFASKWTLGLSQGLQAAYEGIRHKHYSTNLIGWKGEVKASAPN